MTRSWKFWIPTRLGGVFFRFFFAEGAAGFFSPTPMFCFRRGVEGVFLMVTEFVALHSACKKSGSETMEVSQLHEKAKLALLPRFPQRQGAIKGRFQRS